MQDSGDVKHQMVTKPTNPTYVFTKHGLVLTVTYTSLIIGLDHDDLVDTLFNIILIALVILVLGILDHDIYQHLSYQQATGYDKLARRLFRFTPYLCCLAALPFDPRLASMLVNFTLFKLILQSVDPSFDIDMETETELAQDKDPIEHVKWKRLFWALGALMAFTVYNLFGDQLVEDAFLAVFGKQAEVSMPPAADDVLSWWGPW